MFRIIIVKILLFLVLGFVCNSARSQENANYNFYYEVKEDSLVHYFKKLREAVHDTHRVIANEHILRIFRETLITREAFIHRYDSTKNYFGVLNSPDAQFRVFTWNILFDDNEFKYYGFIQYFDKERKLFTYFPLIDNSKNIENPEYVSLSSRNWFGCLYYEIVRYKVKRKKYGYVLLGWDGNNLHTNKKIFEILYFKAGRPFFGAPIIRHENKTKRRVIFEYSAKARMAMRFDRLEEGIVFDHLTPAKPQYEGVYRFYGADGSYDKFIFKRRRWRVIEDIDARNKREHRPPKKKGFSKGF